MVIKIREDIVRESVYSMYTNAFGESRTDIMLSVVDR